MPLEKGCLELPLDLLQVCPVIQGLVKKSSLIQRHGLV